MRQCDPGSSEDSSQEQMITAVIILQSLKMWFREGVPLWSNMQKNNPSNPRSVWLQTPYPFYCIRLLIQVSTQETWMTVQWNVMLISSISFGWRQSPWPLTSMTNQKYLGSFFNINKPRLTLHLMNQSLKGEPRPMILKKDPQMNDPKPCYQPLTSGYSQYKSSPAFQA